MSGGQCCTENIIMVNYSLIFSIANTVYNKHLFYVPRFFFTTFKPFVQLSFLHSILLCTVNVLNSQDL